MLAHALLPPFVHAGPLSRQPRCPPQTPLSGYQKRCELHRMRRTHHCYGKAIPASRTLFAQPRTANSLHKEIRGREDGRRIRAPQSGAEAWRNAVFEAVRLRIWIFSASALSADILCAKGRRFALFFWVGRTSLRVINLMKPRRSTPPTPSVLPPSLLPSSIPLYVLPPPRLLHHSLRPLSIPEFSLSALLPPASPVPHSPAPRPLSCTSRWRTTNHKC